MEISEIVELFERLDPLLTEKLRKQFPSVARQGHLLSSCEVRLLRKLSKGSNEALHRRTAAGDKNQRALRLLSDARELRLSRLVATARVIEAKNVQY